MLVPHNVRMIPSNVRKKKGGGGITEWDKNTATCDVGTAQCENGTIKCEKNKGTIEYNKSTVTCDVSTIQCGDGTIKCDVLVTWLPTSKYHTKKKKEYGRIIPTVIACL